MTSKIQFIKAVKESNLPLASKTAVMTFIDDIDFVKEILVALIKEGYVEADALFAKLPGQVRDGESYDVKLF